ncbi:MAG TPA: universal stress protein [Pelolinea sp.]|nr:universal stress protein [Pelolinea sp.]
MSHTSSHKLKNSFEGALAGGGDPATSPLYVFGPFLKLIVVAGVAKVTFGDSIWLVVLTIAVVSAVYRNVMRWITDGSGGSGMSEEEFGSWAVKTNAAFTFIEYTLTFLVSMSALATFIADRFPILYEYFFGVQLRVFIAIILSIFTGWLVNRGPKMAARTFGPATFGVLLLLWLMIISAIIKTGFHLPTFTLQGFIPPYLKYTLSGYVRILAVMTGIEVFANLVAAYDGTPAEKSNKAFGSLMIIMFTTIATMLIVGPAVYALSDPINPVVSVFTQTMDKLLPMPVAYLGSLVSIFVLISACAASSQGLQNLSLGLGERHYVPRAFSLRNKFEVADKPVWLQVVIVSLCFLFLGTNEATYLSLYAAGVFVILSMTGWAVTKRLIREARQQKSKGKWLTIAGTMIAALLTSLATIIIFLERFSEGVWLYFILTPLLFTAFSFFRSRIGAPSEIIDYLGHIDANLRAGFGFGQYTPGQAESSAENGFDQLEKLVWKPESGHLAGVSIPSKPIKNVLTLLDGSPDAQQVLPYTQIFCRETKARLTMLSVIKSNEEDTEVQIQMEAYLRKRVENLQSAGIQANYEIRFGSTSVKTGEFVQERGIDLVALTSSGWSGEWTWLSGGLSSKLVQILDIPVFIVHVFKSGSSKSPHFGRILITLDGSSNSEQILPYAQYFGNKFGHEVILMGVPQVPESRKYRSPSHIIRLIRKQVVTGMHNYLDSIANHLKQKNLVVRVVVTGSQPVRAIVDVVKREGIDVVMLTSKGRGGFNNLLTGQVALQVVQQSEKPVLIVPIQSN